MKLIADGKIRQNIAAFCSGFFVLLAYYSLVNEYADTGSEEKDMGTSPTSPRDRRLLCCCAWNALHANISRFNSFPISQECKDIIIKCNVLEVYFKKFWIVKELVTMWSCCLILIIWVFLFVLMFCREFGSQLNGIESIRFAAWYEVFYVQYRQALYSRVAKSASAPSTMKFEKIKDLLINTFSNRHVSNKNSQWL